MNERLAKKRLGEILVEDGALSPENLQEALEQQKKQGLLIGQILIKCGYITEENLVTALAKQLNLPYLPLNCYSVNQEAAISLGHDFSQRNVLLAFDWDDRYIFVAMSDPLNEAAVREIESLSKRKIQIFISSPTEILSTCSHIFTSETGKKELKKAG